MNVFIFFGTVSLDLCIAFSSVKYMAPKNFITIYAQHFSILYDSTLRIKRFIDLSLFIFSPFFSSTSLFLVELFKFCYVCYLYHKRFFSLDGERCPHTFIPKMFDHVRAAIIRSTLNIYDYVERQCCFSHILNGIFKIPWNIFWHDLFWKKDMVTLILEQVRHHLF